MSKQILTTPTIKDITFIKAATDSLPLIVDDGINYALGFFETILVTDHAVLLEQHISRLNSSLKTFNIPVKIDEALIHDIIRQEQLSDIGLKIIVTPSNIIVSTKELHYTDDYYKKGVSLCLSPIIRSSQSFLINHKSLNYGDLILSLRDSKLRGYDDCIFFNEKGYVCETSIANIFIIKNNRLFTPKSSNGLLPGIVRKFIIENFDVVEGKVSIDDLVFADAVFLTNSLVGLVKVNSINFDQNIITKSRFVQMEDFVPESSSYDKHKLFDEVNKKYSLNIL